MSFTGSYQMQGSPGVAAVIETLAMNRGHREASRAVASGTRVDKAGGCGLYIVCLTTAKGQNTCPEAEIRESIWPQLCRTSGSDSSAEK